MSPPKNAISVPARSARTSSGLPVGLYRNSHINVDTTAGMTYGMSSAARKNRAARAATPSRSSASSSEIPSMTVICTPPKSSVRSMLDQKPSSPSTEAKLANPVNTTLVGPKPSPLLRFSCRLWPKA
ncbi:hypothetical protein ACWD4G_32560 [Streptomyces sp. NPDC002643]